LHRLSTVIDRMKELGLGLWVGLLRQILRLGCMPKWLGDRHLRSIHSLVEALDSRIIEGILYWGN